MQKKIRKLTRRKIAAIISVAVTALIICALIIANIFFPLKYLTAYFVSRSRSSSDGVYFHFLDVGQADCTIVEFPDGKTMLIDGGDGSYTNTLKIIKALNRQDIDYIDYLVCTSVNSEHCGGLADIINLKSVGTIYYPYSTNIYINDSYYSFYTAACSSGAHMVISEYGVGAGGGEGDTEYFFFFLSPSIHNNPQGEYALMNESPDTETKNNASAVLWIEYCGCGVFYAGDVQTSVLEGIYDSYMLYSDGVLGSYFIFNDYEVNFADCVLYKAPNHGDEDSTCTLLTDLLSPDISVISVGDNSVGCPSTAFVADLANSSDLYMTMYYGDITVKVNSGGAAVQ